MRFRHDRRRAGGNPELGGTADHAVHRGLYRQRRAPGGPGGEKPDHHQPGEHGPLHQAVHGAALQRGGQRDEDGILHGRGRRARRRQGQDHRRRILSPGDIGAGAAEDEADRRGLPRREGDQGGHHGAGLFQRRAAAGDQGRRPDRRPRGGADHQRADGGGAGLRPRQGEAEREDRGLRPGRRHLRHIHPGAGRRRVRGQIDQRQHAPGRRRFRPADHGMADARVQEADRHRRVRRQDGAPAAQGSGRKGQDRAFQQDRRPRSTSRS